MVWINNEHYNAKSYPREAYGGAMCMCARCQSKNHHEHESMKSCPVCGAELPSGMNSCPACKWGGKK